jgi:hypothetical protein
MAYDYCYESGRQGIGYKIPRKLGMTAIAAAASMLGGAL